MRVNEPVTLRDMGMNNDCVIISTTNLASAFVYIHLQYSPEYCKQR